MSQDDEQGRSHQQRFRDALDAIVPPAVIERDRITPDKLRELQELRAKLIGGRNRGGDPPATGGSK